VAHTATNEETDIETDKMADVETNTMANG